MYLRLPSQKQRVFGEFLIQGHIERIGFLEFSNQFGFSTTKNEGFLRHVYQKIIS